MSDERRPVGGGGARNPRSLANLRPGAGAWQPGQPSPNLRHGLTSRRPGRLILAPLVDEIVESLEAAVPLRGPDGEMLPNFLPAVEAAALLLLQIRRGMNYLSQHGAVDERGRYRPENEQLERLAERFMRALDRLGATPVSYARLGFDVARTTSLADAMSEPDPGRRAEMMRDAGVPIDGDAGEEGRP